MMGAWKEKSWVLWQNIPRLTDLGFPGGSDGKESACSAGDLRLISGPGRSPGEANGYTLQYSCLENPMDKEVWWVTVHSVSKTQTQLSTYSVSVGLAVIWNPVFLPSFFFLRSFLSYWLLFLSFYWSIVELFWVYNIMIQCSLQPHGL